MKLPEKNSKSKIPLQYKELLQIAKLPADNNGEAFNMGNYDITLVDHDYAGQFSRKANHVFRSLKIGTGFIMAIGDPLRAKEILEALRQDIYYIGGGVGSGFKNVVPALLDELDPLAAQIGAVNVIVKNNRGLRGYNTDGVGFVKGLENLLLDKLEYSSVDDLNILILGAGGTAEAIAFTLASKGARLTILNRTTDKSEKLAERICHVYEYAAYGGSENEIEKHLGKADVIINASTKSAEGKFQDFIAFAPAREGYLAENLSHSARAIKLTKPNVVICDINLRVDESPTLTLARNAKKLTQDGSAMNFHQAVEALWLIHGDHFIWLGVSKEKLAELIKEVSNF